MNLEKLGLILFIKYMRQFDQVKRHLLSSVRELLLAMSATLQITNQITNDNFVLSRLGPVETTFKKIDTVLNYSIEQIGGGNENSEPQNDRHLKNNIVESIISVIDEEIEKLNAYESNNKDLKIEALFTVKTVLNQHLRQNCTPIFKDVIEVERAVNA